MMNTGNATMKTIEIETNNKETVMQRIKPPRHKLLNDMLKQCKNEQHEDKHGNHVSRAKANKQCRKYLREELYE